MARQAQAYSQYMQEMYHTPPATPGVLPQAPLGAEYDASHYLTPNLIYLVRLLVATALHRLALVLLPLLLMVLVAIPMGSTLYLP